MALTYFGVFAYINNQRPGSWSAKKGYFLGHGIFVTLLLGWLIFLRFF